MTQAEHLSQHNKDNVIAAEQKAYDDLVMYYNRVVLMDEMNTKALRRAGKVGTAVHKLLDAVNLYLRIQRNGR